MPWHAPFQLNPFFVFPIALAVAALAGVRPGRSHAAAAGRLPGDRHAGLRRDRPPRSPTTPRTSPTAPGARSGCRTCRSTCSASHYAWGIDPLPYYYLLLASIVIVMVAFGRLGAFADRPCLGGDPGGRGRGRGRPASPTLRMKLLAFAHRRLGVGIRRRGARHASSSSTRSRFSAAWPRSSWSLVVIFGGMGSRLGVVVGSVVLLGLAYYLRDMVPAGGPVHLLRRRRGHHDDLPPARARAAAPAPAARSRPPGAGIGGGPIPAAADHCRPATTAPHRLGRDHGTEPACCGDGASGVPGPRQAGRPGVAAATSVA